MKIERVVGKLQVNLTDYVKSNLIFPSRLFRSTAILTRSLFGLLCFPVDSQEILKLSVLGVGGPWLAANPCGPLSSGRWCRHPPRHSPRRPPSGQRPPPLSPARCSHSSRRSHCSLSSANLKATNSPFISHENMFNMDANTFIHVRAKKVEKSFSRLKAQIFRGEGGKISNDVCGDTSAMITHTVSFLV